ncbi:MAG: hypothetical protein ABF689_07650, partial [Gluconobacter cerinus]
MQNRPASSRSGLWSRLPVIGRLLIVFWGVVLVGWAAPPPPAGATDPAQPAAPPNKKHKTPP